jgi:hypothetical protein
MAEEFHVILSSATLINWHDEKGDLNQIPVAVFHRLVAEHRRLMVEQLRQRYPATAGLLRELPFHAAVNVLVKSHRQPVCEAAAIVRGLQ